MRTPMKKMIAKNFSRTLCAFSCALTLIGGASSLFTPAAFAKDTQKIVNNKNVVVNWSDLKPSEAQIISSLNIFEILRRYHYLKFPFDDQRSSLVYDNYLKTLDPYRIYFLEDDISKFEPYRHQLYRFLKYGQLKQGFSIYQTYLSKIQERLEFTLASLNKGIDKIDFNSNDELLIDREKAPWPKDKAEQLDLWNKRLKDDVLRLKLANKKDKDIVEQLTKRYNNQLKRLKQTTNEDIFQVYINAFTLSYDPHTEYMSPETAENFDINMSLSLEGIGAVLQNDNDYAKIVRLVPAGPAQKSKQLKPADRIVGVAQDQQETVDVIGWRLEDVVKLIRGPKGSKVHLEVIPADNPPGDLTTKQVTITREAVKLEDQAAKKSVLTLDYRGQKRKIGIIELPAFYLDFKGVKNKTPDYKSSVRDVKKLLVELQKEHVEGIVIDLRNNGGGSLQEATDLTGLFVPPGPAVQVRNSSGQVNVLDDTPTNAAIKPDTNPLYTGPLIILVNRLSASASEIFAGAMQDYNRALVVGGQTFGKGTVQSVLPLKHGELKLTVAKFYRVSGKSTQNKGVIPDITYPETVDSEQIGESSLPAAMPWDTIKPAITTANDPYKDFLPTLQNLHENRIKTNPDFIFLKQRMDLMKKLSEQKTLSLNESIRKKQKLENENTLLALENARRTAKGEKLLTSLEDNEEDTLSAEEEASDKLPEKDAYLVESASILLDYITLTNPND